MAVLELKESDISGDFAPAQQPKMLEIKETDITGDFTPAPVAPAVASPQTPALNTSPNPAPVAAPTPVEPKSATIEGGPNALSRGFWSGLAKETPELYGDFFEATGHIAGETLKPSFDAAAEYARKFASQPKGYEKRGRGVFDSESFSEFLGNLGEAVGSGAASMVPTVVGAGTGAAVGAAAGAPFAGVGAAPGAVGGAVVGGLSTGTAASIGEVYKALKEEKVDPKEAAKYAYMAGSVMGALDTALPGAIAAKFAGVGEAKRAVARGLAKRIAAEMGKGAAIEGGTEVTQEFIKQTTENLVAGKELFTLENTKELAESGLVGAVLGGPMSAPGGLKRDRTTNEATPADIQGATDAVTAGGITPSPAPVAAPQPSLALTPDQISADVVLPSQPTFYSPARKAIEEKGPNVATAEQWAATITQTPGVKTEELRDMGLDVWLRNNQGKRLTKQEVLEFVEDNAIMVTETHRLPKAATPNAWTDMMAQNTDGTRYEAYTLPGAREGYTELLLQIPAKADNTEAQADIQRRLEIGEINPEQAEAERLHLEGPGGQVGAETFRTGHWPDNLNVIAHVRITERRDTSGAPMAFVEEIQSDWHQQGQNAGYKVPLNDPRVIQARQDRVAAHAEAIRVQNATEKLGFSEERRAARTAFEEADMRLRRLIDGGVPDAPFKQSWDELAIKRVVRWAIDKGYSRIGFPTGEQVDLIQGNPNPGRAAFYDKKIPSIVKKWAKRLGATISYVPIPGGTNRYEMDYSSIDNLVGAYDRTTGAFIEFEDLSAQFAGVDMASRDGLVIFDRIQPEIDARIAAMNQDGGTHVVPVMEMSPEGMRLAAQGLPLYSEPLPTNRGSEVIAPTDVLSVKARDNIRDIINELTKQFNVPDLQVVFHAGQTILYRDFHGQPARDQALGMYVPWDRQIHVALGFHNNFLDAWATVAHEFGHHVHRTLWANAPNDMKIAVKAAYDKWKAEHPLASNFDEMIYSRDNAMISLFETRGPPLGTANISDTPRPSYWISFDEWFAEQVARWATTSVKPVSVVEKFFKGFATKLVAALKAAYKKFNLDFTAEPVLAKWLDSHVADPQGMQNVMDQADAETRRENQNDLDPNLEEIAQPQQPETVLVKDMMKKLFGGTPPIEVRKAGAAADKFNWFYKWGLALQQLAVRNLHIRPLQLYTEIINVAQQVKQAIMGDAHETLKMWQALGVKQADAVTSLIDDVTNMVYRTPDEVKNKVARYPTQQEMADLVKKHGVTKEGIEVFKQVALNFNRHLDRLEALLTHEANKISDPVEQARALYKVQERMKALRSQPYFPFMRFGNYTLTVRDAAGKVIHFELFERQRTRDAAVKEIKKQLTNGETVTPSYLKEQARPLIGVPTAMLDLMAQKLNLTVDQRNAMEQLRFELAPAQSFKHRFQNKRRTKGYSTDFQRAFAHYFFHGANHFTKVRYATDLRELVMATGKEAEIPGVDSTKRIRIVNFMEDHLQNWLDPKSDWAGVRALGFLWALAFNPASAALNLTQTLTTTYPFLASKFGDAKAVAAMLRAGTQVNSFYKKGSYQGLTDFDMKALAQAIKDGTITEAMATELAAVGEGRNLAKGFGTLAERVVQQTQKLGASMFELAEQTNRRITFRAALALAKADPSNKHIAATVQKHALAHKELVDQGWTDAEAAAYVVAKDAVDTTQFKYGRDFNPRFMRGKARSIFIFKSYVQNMLFFLWNQPSAAVRSTLIMAYLGGLMGLPGADDLEAILKVIGHNFFGKDWDLEKEARKFVISLVGDDENGRNMADIVTLGTSRRGFGLPWMADMLGGTVGVDVPMPTFDRSRAVGMGLILPVDLGKLFGPPTSSNSTDSAIASESQRASGAVFGIGFNLYRAMRDYALNIDDGKRWEKTLPRAAANVSKMYRGFTEGRERSRKDGTIINYDIHDPEQLFEVIGLGMGYTPYRLSLEWNRIIAGQEAVKYWDIRRTGILTQYERALRSKDPEQLSNMQQAVRKFNVDLPDFAKGKVISADTIRQSMQARQRARSAQEAGSAVRKSDIPILREVQKLYPDSQSTVRKVRGSP